ncbi:methyltransferase-like 26 isoform X3 [Physella acuta]|nr:methyltransferase-like 26 isoform X3 [Physella acuta]XP_059139640.1 methyltransferase-like 26 isoform X3 [Physella acuta]XP_059139642.1 methyltransferase-like 26 isoform X3 [Physella acuta]
MLVAGAADRNKQPILDVLQGYLPPINQTGRVLEIASGTGQHIAHFAAHFQHVLFQPSDIDRNCVSSITAYIENKKLTNVLQPVEIDVTKPIDQWPGGKFEPSSWDVILNSNMIHISPWESAVGLFKASGYLLKDKGVLFMYGPYKVNGVLTPESNVRFNQQLIAQNPSWGVRDIVDLEKLAKDNNLCLEKMVDMPANNKCVIFRKTS